jgi:hypothetical protein
MCVCVCVRERSELLPVASVSAFKLRHDRRAFLRHELQHLFSLLTDSPGLAGPKFEVRSTNQHARHHQQQQQHVAMC